MADERRRWSAEARLRGAAGRRRRGSDRAAGAFVSLLCGGSAEDETDCYPPIRLCVWCVGIVSCGCCGHLDLRPRGTERDAHRESTAFWFSFLIVFSRLPTRTQQQQQSQTTCRVDEQSDKGTDEGAPSSPHRHTASFVIRSLSHAFPSPLSVCYFFFSLSPSVAMAVRAVSRQDGDSASSR